MYQGKKGRDSPWLFLLLAIVASLLYEDCVSAELFVEVDDVLDDQAYAFMCAVWRIAQYTVYCQDPVVHHCSADQQGYVYDSLAPEQVRRKSLGRGVSIGDEAQEILSLPGPVYQLVSRRIHVHKHPTTSHRFGVSA